MAMPKQTNGIPHTCHGKLLANATAVTLGDFKMTEQHSQQSLEPTADNIVPFPATSASNTTGITEQPHLYTAEDLRLVFSPDSQTTRTVRDLVAKVREAYHWLDEAEFKRGDKFTQFCLDQIKLMKDSGLTQKQWIAEIQKQAPKPQQPQPEAVEQPIEAEIVDELHLPSSAIVPIAGQDRLTQSRQELQTNNQQLQDKLAQIQQRLTEHQHQKTANEESFDLNLKNRRAALLAKVAEAAIEDKLTAEQLYDSIVSGQLDLSPKSPVTSSSSISS
jgi:hypothetical protein